MASKISVKQPIGLLKTAVNCLFQNPIILLPFFIIAFIQIIVLEILFFAPRYPLSIFFEPLITKLSGEMFLHYPLNFILLGKWFQKFQIPIYILVNSLLLGIAVCIIKDINSDKTLRAKKIFRKTLSSYVHLITVACISVALLLGLSKLYSLVVGRAMLIRSTSGIYFIIKKAVISGTPYFNLLFAIIITTLFAFVVPIIIIEKKKIFSAIVLNFKNLRRSFLLIFTVIFLSSILYIPVFLIKSSKHLFQEVFPPEVFGIMLIVSVLATLLIDAVQITAVTTYYLLEKEK